MEDKGKILIVGNSRAKVMQEVIRKVVGERVIQLRLVTLSEPPPFDPMKLHLCLRDEACMEKNPDLDEAWETFRKQGTPDGIQFPGSFHDFKTQRRSVRVLVEHNREELLPQILSKGAVPGETKKVKHNPRPSRFGFLEWLKTYKRG